MTTWVETPKSTGPTATYALLIDDASHFLLIDDAGHRLLLQDEQQGIQWTETPKT